MSLDCLYGIVLLSWHRPVLQYTFLLELPSLYPTGFWAVELLFSFVSTYCLIAILIWSLIHWIFRSMSWSFHAFVGFFVFSLLNLFLVSYLCGLRSWLVQFQSFWIYWGSFCGLVYDLFLIPCTLEKNVYPAAMIC